MPYNTKFNNETGGSNDRLSTGISGLDEILKKGLIARRVYLVRGGPGTGKSTIGLHFLENGAALNEKVLFITLGEPEEQLRKNAASLGFDLKDIHFLLTSRKVQSFQPFGVTCLFQKLNIALHFYLDEETDIIFS